MSVSTIVEFEEATAFERYALALATPVLSPNRSSFDCRSNRGVFSFSEVLWGPSLEEEIAKFRPLLFGAAWKVLDLLVELSLTCPGSVHAGVRILQIRQKVHAAGSGAGTLPPLSTDSDVWLRLMKTYAAFEEPRHCLVHRKIEVGPSRELRGLVDRSGNPIPDVTAEAQESLVAVSQCVCAGILGIPQGARWKPSLLYHLDKLSGHHGMPILGGPRVFEVVNLIADAEQDENGHWKVDLPGIRGKMIPMLPGRHFDLEIHFPNSAHYELYGQLESMPTSVEVVDPDRPPAWLHR